MEPELIELSQRERDRLKVLHEVERGHLTQVEAAGRLGVTDRHVRRLLGRVRAEGDRGVVHRLRGRPSNRKLAHRVQQRVLAQLRRRYQGFGPTLAAEHLVGDGLAVSRETLRKWMITAGLWRPRRPRLRRVYAWRERRAALGELVLWDSSPFAWLEERGPTLQLIAMIDDATSRFWGRFAEHDSVEENLRVLAGWLRRQGRPVAFYTDKDSLFVVNRAPELDEQLRGQPALTQIGRALRELGIDWIPAHSPQAKGRIERLFETLQDRLEGTSHPGNRNPLTLQDAGAGSGDETFDLVAGLSEERANRRERLSRQCGTKPSSPLPGAGLYGFPLWRALAAYGTLPGAALGHPAGPGSGGIAGCTGGGRAAAGRQPLGALPRQLPAAAGLPGAAARVGNPCRP